MTSLLASPAAAAPSQSAAPSLNLHRIRLYFAILVALSALACLAWYGYDYYSLDVIHRTQHPKHKLLRSTGAVGLRLGMAGGFLFFWLYLYSVRKKVKRLSKIGKTKNWLDFHVLMGICAPILITLHSAFRFQGLAGVAYWIMIAVLLSGIVGRYLYSLIPKSLSATELGYKELENLYQQCAADLSQFHLVPPSDLEHIAYSPDASLAKAMPLWRAFGMMLWLDVSRPFRVASLRRRFMTTGERLRSAGGLFRSTNPTLERTIALARRQAWLAAKLSFLDRAKEIFHLWHVVHRPFSYSFLVLIAVHVAVALLLGYY
ncbi:MAG: hypothetical protein U0R19_12140 [Bryobacteraceae bacterium]